MWRQEPCEDATTKLCKEELLRIGLICIINIFKLSLSELMLQLYSLNRMNPLNLLCERFLVAQDSSGNVVACGQLASIPGSPPFQELRSLVVVKSRRKQGIGTRLLHELLARAEGKVYLLTIGRA